MLFVGTERMKRYIFVRHFSITFSLVLLSFIKIIAVVVLARFPSVLKLSTIRSDRNTDFCWQ